jgi:hypothetical protein
MYSILGCFTTPSFATSARTASKRLKAHGCSAVLSLIPGKIPIIHWPTSTTGKPLGDVRTVSSAA